jgi:hypothetical protein
MTKVIIYITACIIILISIFNFNIEGELRAYGEKKARLEISSRNQETSDVNCFTGHNTVNITLINNNINVASPCDPSFIISEPLK